MNEPVRIVEVPEAALPLDFDAFLERQHQGLYSALCLVTRDRAEAEDVMQEAFLRVWERWDRIRELDRPDGYLYRTAFNVWRNRRRGVLRALKRAVDIVQRDDLSDVETRLDVVRALGWLTPRQRAALVLTDLLGYPSEEAGRMLGIKAPTVRVLASKGREELRRRMGEIDE